MQYPFCPVLSLTKPKDSKLFIQFARVIITTRRSMKPGLFLFICLVGITIAACKNGKNERHAAVDPESVYLDYSIIAEEENEMVSCLFKFKYYGRNGRTILLPGPANVQLDGIRLEADSAGFEGVYYELVKPLAEFGG